MRLEENELINIKGGATTYSLSSTMLNSVSKVIDTIMDVGRSLGTAIRRIYSDNLC